jgi:hypothetical protein
MSEHFLFMMLGGILALLVAALAAGVRALQLRQTTAAPFVPPPPLEREPMPREAPTLPPAEEIDRQLLELLDERSPRVDCDLSEALYRSAGRPGPELAFHVRAVGPRLDALEKAGEVLVVGFPGRLYFGRRHEAAARAAGWSPAEDVRAYVEAIEKRRGAA